MDWVHVVLLYSLISLYLQYRNVQHYLIIYGKSVRHFQLIGLDTTSDLFPKRHQEEVALQGIDEIIQLNEGVQIAGEEEGKEKETIVEMI